jgi:hypothetical protein
MIIDLRDYDRQEHPTQPVDGALQFLPDQYLCQRIRDGLNAKREADAFADAERRMRFGS